MAQSHRQEPTVINHYDKAFSPIFRVYLTEVLKTILDKSTIEHGPYRLNFYSRHLSTNRSRLETEKGSIINVLFASHWNGRYLSQNRVIAVPLPVFKGMLGLRSLIATSENNARIDNVEEIASFKHLIAGQGANWEDVQILRDNDVPVTEAQSFDALFPMLAKGRYDYLPLASLEVQTALRTKGLAYENLELNNRLSIYYPMPFYVFVNGQRPDIAKRMADGFAIASEDGSIARLFERHFGFLETELNREMKKLIILKNTVVSDKENNAITHAFLDQYGQYFDIVQH